MRQLRPHPSPRRRTSCGCRSGSNRRWISSPTCRLRSCALLRTHDLRERVRDVHDVNSELRDEIEHSFQRYKELEPSKQTETRGWGKRAEAADIVAAARGRVGA